jgi:hypothetical protein
MRESRRASVLDLREATEAGVWDATVRGEMREMRWMTWEKLKEKEGRKLELTLSQVKRKGSLFEENVLKGRIGRSHGARRAQLQDSRVDIWDK